jgi:hypothetical protein
MDKLAIYRPIIERILGEQLEFAAGDEGVETFAVTDQNKENYLLLEVGWQHPRRIYNVVIHLRLQQGKIHIEQDWTREGVGYQLAAAGVPPELIELDYQPPETRLLAQRQMSQQMAAALS